MQTAPQTTELLAGFPVLRTGNLDEARHAVAQRFCDHRLDHAGKGRALKVRHNHVGGRHVSLNYLGYGGPVSIDPGLLGSFYLLQIPLSGTALVRHRGEDVVATTRRASLLNPDRPTQMNWQAGCRKILLQVDADYLGRVAEEQLGVPLPGPVRFDPTVNLQGHAGQRLRNLVLGAVRAAEDGQLFGGKSGLHDICAERELACALLELQPSNVSHMFQTQSASVLPNHLRRAIEYMHANLTDPIRLSDIAAHTGLNPRSLQIGFKNAFGLSPIAYLRDVRLDAAHYQLKARRNRESVTAVAFACGFSHLGRFSRDYRDRFGHLPSDAH